MRQADHAAEQILGEGRRCGLDEQAGPPHQDGAGHELWLGGRLDDLATGEPVEHSECGLVVPVYLIMARLNEPIESMTLGNMRANGLSLTAKPWYPSACQSATRPPVDERCNRRGFLGEGQSYCFNAYTVLPPHFERHWRFADGSSALGPCAD
jgi:hypothetical protein